MKKSLYVFGILNDDDIDWFLAVGKLVEFASGEFLIRRGEFPPSLILLIDGRCDIVIDTSSRHVINHCGGGELLGELSFIDDLPASASVVATEPSRGLCITRQSLDQRLQTESDFAARFYHSIAYFMADRIRSSVIRELRLTEAGTAASRLDESEELPLSLLDKTALAASRYHHLLQRLRVR